MLLDRINKTNDIKKFNLKEKNILAKEIRNYLLEIISNNPKDKELVSTFKSGIFMRILF